RIARPPAPGAADPRRRGAARRAHRIAPGSRGPARPAGARARVPGRPADQRPARDPRRARRRRLPDRHVEPERRQPLVAARAARAVADRSVRRPPAGDRSHDLRLDVPRPDGASQAGLSLEPQQPLGQRALPRCYPRRCPAAENWRRAAVAGDNCAMREFRRESPRIGIEALCWELVAHQEISGMAIDLSPNGLRIERPYTGGPTRREVPLQLEVPGIDEVMWAKADACFDHLVP